VLFQIRTSTDFELSCRTPKQSSENVRLLQKVISSVMLANTRLAVCCKHAKESVHGWLVFQDTESLAKDGDFSGVFEAHRGCRAFEFLCQVDCHVADRAESEGGVASAGSAVVLPSVAQSP